MENKKSNTNSIKEISKIKLPNNQIFQIKDEEARKGLEWLLGKKNNN